jgi:hypothetical protein
MAWARATGMYTAWSLLAGRKVEPSAVYSVWMGERDFEACEENVRTYELDADLRTCDSCRVAPRRYGTLWGAPLTSRAPSPKAARAGASTL